MILLSNKLSESGIFNVKEIYGVPVTVNLVEPKGKRNVRTFMPLKEPYYISVHDTQNYASSAGDEMHAKYIQNVENEDSAYVSWHITVDEDSITQHIPLFELTYNSGSKWGNKCTISIEICVNGDFSKAMENALKVIIFLQEELCIPNEKVKPHYYFADNKKLCPKHILISESKAESNWGIFISSLDSLRDTISKSKLDNIPDDYAKELIEQAYALGIFSGDSEGNWHLSSMCKKQDIIVMIMNAVNILSEGRGDLKS